MKTIATALAMTLLAGAALAAGMLQPDERFPAWSLTDQTGKKVSSQDLAGKTYLLWFYPKAMTSGCTTEGVNLRDRAKEFEAAGVEVVGVSFDTPQDNAQFAEKNNFPFRLLSDTDRAFSVKVGAADSPDRKWARRISYLVGPDGTVLKAYSNVDPATHAAEVLQDVKARR